MCLIEIYSSFQSWEFTLKGDLFQSMKETGKICNRTTLWCLKWLPGFFLQSFSHTSLFLLEVFFSHKSFSYTSLTQVYHLHVFSCTALFYIKPIFLYKSFPYTNLFSCTNHFPKQKRLTQVFFLNNSFTY